MVAGAVVELRQRQLGAEILLGDEDLVVGQGVDQLAVGFGREGAAGEPDGVGVVVERDVLELQPGCMCVAAQPWNTRSLLPSGPLTRAQSCQRIQGLRRAAPSLCSHHQAADSTAPGPSCPSGTCYSRQI